MKVNKNLQPVSIPIEPHNQYIKMTPKEALDKLVKYVSVAIDDRWDLLTEDTKYPLMRTEEYKAIEQALTELEELKRDVKRYFHDNDLEGDEYNMLWSKLMKAGNGK